MCIGADFCSSGWLGCFPFSLFSPSISFLLFFLSHFCLFFSPLLLCIVLPFLVLFLYRSTGRGVYGERGKPTVEIRRTFLTVSDSLASTTTCSATSGALEFLNGLVVCAICISSFCDSVCFCFLLTIKRVYESTLSLLTHYLLQTPPRGENWLPLLPYTKKSVRGYKCLWAPGFRYISYCLFRWRATSGVVG